MRGKNGFVKTGWKGVTRLKKERGKAKYEITGIGLELDKSETGNHTIEGDRREEGKR